MTPTEFSYENITYDDIKKILESSFTPFGIDDDGDIFLKESPRVFIKLSNTKKRLSFFCLFKGGSSDDFEKYKLVNKINISTYFPKAMITSEGNVRFDYDIDITCPVSTMFFITTLRQFSSKVKEVVSDEEYENLFS